VVNLLSPPAIILVRPQLGENIGMCARAMLNCGVAELRIVAPRDGWPSESALSASAGAVAVIENARIFATTAEAVADLKYVLATTARGRDMAKPVITLNDAARIVREKGGAQCGILFGPERAGLENDDVALADAILNIPLNPGFSSLNLAQAVLLTCHAWLSADNPFVPIPDGAEEPAAKAEIENLAAHFEEAMEAHGFFRSAEKRPTVMRNLRNFLFRGAPTAQEAGTLHGIIACLAGPRTKA
jgi:tRNA/rRNA methyltransferase